MSPRIKGCVLFLEYHEAPSSKMMGHELQMLPVEHRAKRSRAKLYREIRGNTNHLLHTTINILQVMWRGLQQYHGTLALSLSGYGIGILERADDSQDLAPNDTAYKRWSCHSGLRLLCRLCRTTRHQHWGPYFPFFGPCRPCRPAGWLALLLTKAGDVETNPGPTTLNKKVWICDICHKQIHVRKQISIRCNRIEHLVHLRCAGIRQAQYTDTWTCHLHRESRLTPHTDITPPHRSRTLVQTTTHSPPTPPTPPQPKHRHMSNTPPVPTGLVKPKPNSQKENNNPGSHYR